MFSAMDNNNYSGYQPTDDDITPSDSTNLSFDALPDKIGGPRTKVEEVAMMV